MKGERVVGGYGGGETGEQEEREITFRYSFALPSTNPRFGRLPLSRGSVYSVS